MTERTESINTDFDVIVIGAGFAGMYMLHRLRNSGLSVRVLEAGSGVGGTWYWNRYPGARCDTESMYYSYQFSSQLQQEWVWTERYPSQPQILEYANHVADRFDLRRDIQFDVRVVSSKWDETNNFWSINVVDGTHLTARFCIMATGCLSSINLPDFKGLKTFRGDIFHTGQWPNRNVDFTGKCVAVIGTGSSGIQIIPEIAKCSQQLYVFQRTANYVVPARNQPLDPQEVTEIKANYSTLRAKAKSTYSGNIFETGGPSALSVSADERNQEYESRWQMGGLCFMGAFEDLQLNTEANETAAQFIRTKIEAEVENPHLAKLLSPRGLFGCKRLSVASGYYETFNRNNVSLIDISEKPIDHVNSDGISVAGQQYVVDAIVMATGFDAMTGALNKIDIRGTNNTALKDKWENGPRTYLGLLIAGFPNLFIITGPGSPSVLTNMLPSIEQHVEWIMDCIDYLQLNAFTRVESEIDAENDWMKHVNESADISLRSTCLSWYLGSNVPGKPRVFMPYIGGFPVYTKKCDQVAGAGYPGLTMC